LATLQVLHDKICTPCNEALGRGIEYEFIRSGPEGMFRAGLGIEGRRGAATGNPFYHRAATTQPVRGTYRNLTEPDYTDLHWEMVPGPGGQPEGRLLEQIVVVDGAGRRQSVPFNINWTPDVLRQAHRPAALRPPG
jgi:hypothetical protein